MVKLCIKCQEEINPLRIKALPTARTCVGCSTETPKKGRILTLGTGDHTYNEIEILTEESYRNIVELEESRGIFKRKKKVQDFKVEEEEEEVLEEENTTLNVPLQEEEEEETYVDLYENEEE